MLLAGGQPMRAGQPFGAAVHLRPDSKHMPCPKLSCSKAEAIAVSVQLGSACLV